MTGHWQSPWSDPLSFKDKSFKTHNISKCQQQMLQNIKDSVSPIECNSRIGNLMQEQNWMNSEKTFCLTQHHHCIDHCAWELVWSWSISHLVFYYYFFIYDECWLSGNSYHCKKCSLKNHASIQKHTHIHTIYCSFQLK